MPQSPLRGDPPSPRVSVSFASHRWGAGGGARCTGEAGEGGVHSEDCRPRGGFVPQGFYPPREDRRGEGVGSNSPRNISPPQDLARPPSWSHLAPDEPSHPLLAWCPPLCVAVFGARNPVQSGQVGAGGSPISPVYGWVLSLVSEGGLKLRIFYFATGSSPPPLLRRRRPPGGR